MSKVTGAELKARVHALSSTAAIILDMSYLSIGDGQRAADHRQPRRRDSRKSKRRANLHFLPCNPAKQEEFSVPASRSRGSVWGKSPRLGDSTHQSNSCAGIHQNENARDERPPPAPSSSVMNSRRFIPATRQRGRALYQAP